MAATTKSSALFKEERPSFLKKRSKKLLLFGLSQSGAAEAGLAGGPYLFYKTSDA
jgi:hypothetical protein